MTIVRMSLLSFNFFALLLVGMENKESKYYEIPEWCEGFALSQVEAESRFEDSTLLLVISWANRQVNFNDFIGFWGREQSGRLQPDPFMSEKSLHKGAYQKTFEEGKTREITNENMYVQV